MGSLPPGSVCLDELGEFLLEKFWEFKILLEFYFLGQHLEFSEFSSSKKGAADGLDQLDAAHIAIWMF